MRFNTMKGVEVDLVLGEPSNLRWCQAPAVTAAGILSDGVCIAGHGYRGGRVPWCLEADHFRRHASI